MKKQLFVAVFFTFLPLLSAKYIKKREILIISRTLKAYHQALGLTKKAFLMNSFLFTSTQDERTKIITVVAQMQDQVQIEG